ncbi:hypothetical protein B9N43_08575 [Denitratisoma sp. DHT3]|uniref:heme biosynthesis HemY N-terminal domain-containing protein n=1 Tax=Denitratisoma sp. DHT3 TaxID=1981880 RepID=UPI001198C0B2|nr:heme biosynthesis HemY N-terminal domain-containing protein [Denitratisoma sp. DHT3]QDX81293.1 hypothetical protein B9N43_08575 [Denitratisoma sp. DHT3]
MRVLLWLIALAALAVGLSLAARYNAGYVLFVLPPWRVELSLNLLVLLTLGGFFLLHLLLRGAAAVLAMPAQVAAFRADRLHAKSQMAIQDAGRLLLEGRFGHALKRAEMAYRAGQSSAMATLIAQVAAHNMGDRQKSEHWRELGGDRADDPLRMARLMVDATVAAESRDFLRARAALQALEREKGRHIAALRLSLKVEQGLGNWREVLHLLRQLEKHHAMTPTQAAALRLRAHRGNLRALGDDRDGLGQYLARMPEEERRDPRLALDAARRLIAIGDCSEAARLIEDALAEQWDSALVSAYGECEGGDVLRRISHAEKWLPSQPRDAQLLLTLGRLCRRQQLWGKAQSYLEASLSVRPLLETHLELAQLLDYLERPEEANSHYRAAAALKVAENQIAIQ